jgi:hypothetical protein
VSPVNKASIFGKILVFAGALLFFIFVFAITMKSSRTKKNIWCGTYQHMFVIVGCLILVNSELMTECEIRYLSVGGTMLADDCILTKRTKKQTK